MNSLQSRYFIQEVLGDGSTCEVYKVQDKTTLETYACKIMPKKIFQTPIEIEQFHREISIMKTLSHPNITRFINFFEDESKYYLNMEYCKDGDLYTYISTYGLIPETTAAHIFYQVTTALKYCHERGITHRDIKPENILITNFPEVKLSDFGACGLINLTNNQFHTFCGSPCFSSPERIRGEAYDGIKGDIYSLGVTLYCMVTGEFPWDVTNTKLMIQEILANDVQIPNYVSSDCAELILRMMSPRAKDRPSIPEILNSPWLQSNNHHHFSLSAPHVMKGIPHQNISLREIFNNEDSEFNQFFSQLQYDNSTLSENIESESNEKTEESIVRATASQEIPTFQNIKNNRLPSLIKSGNSCNDISIKKPSDSKINHVSSLISDLTPSQKIPTTECNRIAFQKKYPPKIIPSHLTKSRTKHFLVNPKCNNHFLKV